MVCALAVAGVIYLRKSSPSKVVGELLGPDAMKPRPVQPAVPMDKALQMLVSGLTSMQEHGGWRITHQTSNELAAEMEYRHGTGRGAAIYSAKLKFHAQFRPLGQQTEVTWRYEDDSLSSDSIPAFGWGALCNQTSAAILSRLGLS